MHTRAMSDDEGDFAPAQTAAACRDCGSAEVTCWSWDSSCGGYTDYHYECRACGFEWWVDGADA